MVLEEETKLKKALSSYVLEHKAMAIFDTQGWRASQRFYVKKKGEKVKDLDVFATKELTIDSTLFRYKVRLQMLVLIKEKNDLTYIGINWNPSESRYKRGVEVVTPFFKNRYDGTNMIGHMPGIPAPLCEKTYQILLQNKPNGKKFFTRFISYTISPISLEVGIKYVIIIKRISITIQIVI